MLLILNCRGVGLQNVLLLQHALLMQAFQIRH